LIISYLFLLIMRKDEKNEKNIKQIWKKIIEYSRFFNLCSVFKLVDPDPNPYLVYGSGSRRANNTDPTGSRSTTLEEGLRQCHRQQRERAHLFFPCIVLTCSILALPSLFPRSSWSASRDMSWKKISDNFKEKIGATVKWFISITDNFCKTKQNYLRNMNYVYLI